MGRVAGALRFFFFSVLPIPRHPKVPAAFWERFYVRKNLQKAWHLWAPGISFFFFFLNLECVGFMIMMPRTRMS